MLSYLSVSGPAYDHLVFAQLNLFQPPSHAGSLDAMFLFVWVHRNALCLPYVELSPNQPFPPHLSPPCHLLTQGSNSYQVLLYASWTERQACMVKWPGLSEEVPCDRQSTVPSALDVAPCCHGTQANAEWSMWMTVSLGSVPGKRGVIPYALSWNLGDWWAFASINPAF
jgi:hypothetical protein